MTMDFCETSYIYKLPENILLEIFTYLTISDRCRVGRVCKAWRRISLDNRLWRHVDMTSQKMTLTQIWKLMRSRLSDVLVCLRLRGHLDSACHRMGKGSLSDALLLHLRDRCPRLSSLHLTHADIARFPTASLPARLSTLSITHSYLRLGWFRNAPLGALQHLDLSDSRVFDSDLADICSVTVGLRSLRLDGCYRLTDGGLQTVARRLPQLASLHLADVTRTTDLALHHVGRHLGELRHLGLSGWTSLTDSGVALVTSALPLLHSLHLDRCTLLSDNVLKLLLQGSQLRFLRLSSATFTPTAIDEFRARTTCSLEIMS